jgi:hypothetical protein
MIESMLFSLRIDKEEGDVRQEGLSLYVESRHIPHECPLSLENLGCWTTKGWDFFGEKTFSTDSLSRARV